MVIIRAAGANLHGQWFTSSSAILDKFKTIQDNINSIELTGAKLATVTWSYNIIFAANAFFVSGSWLGREAEFVKLGLPENLKDVSLDTNFILIGNDYRLVLIDAVNHELWSLPLSTRVCEWTHKKINLNTETDIECGFESKRSKTEIRIKKALLFQKSIVVLTSEGFVYLLPSKLDTKCVGNVTDVDCGYEHIILLSEAGSVYTMGNGRRCQLGHGDLTNLEQPTEVEALAGVKIKKIKAGGWHTLALSAEGDLYAWGWNDTGQLGIKKGTSEDLKSYPIPKLVDFVDEEGKILDLNVKQIACGSRHSAVILDDQTVWTTGFNKYGQLSFPPQEVSYLSYFRRTLKCLRSTELLCGPWCTVLIENIQNEIMEKHT